MRLLVDIDGVIADTVESGLGFFNSQFRTRYLRGDITEYNPKLKINDYGDRVPFGEYLIEKLKTPEFHRSTRPMPGSIMALNEVIMEGHTIVLVTARSLDRAADLTKVWLDNNVVPYHDLQFRKDKENMTGQLLIEDHRDTLIRWNGWEDPGYLLRPGLLFNTDYNQGHLPWPLRRVEDWFDALAYIKGDLHKRWPTLSE